MVFGIELTMQAAFSGLVTGLIYAVFAAGFVLVYRSTGVLNFAQGETGAFGVAIFTLLAAGYGVPYWLAFGAGVLVAALVGMTIDLTVIRRLSNSSRLVVLIATVGISQILFFARLNLPNTAASATFPLPFDLRWRPTDSILVVSREILVLVVAPLTVGALAFFMTRTRFGLMVRASASNPDTARIFGISVKRTSTIVWTIAGAFAALTAIMLAPMRGITPGNIVSAGAVALGPGLLVRALVVGLIARMHSLPMTLVGGIGLGLAESVTRLNVGADNQAIVEVWIFLAALVLVLRWKPDGESASTWSLGARVPPIPERLRHLWYVRHLSTLAFGLLFGLLAVVPLFLDQRSQELLWTDVLIFAMMALPLSMLIGWAGQFSLGQATFAGIGAGTMVILTHGLDIPVPFDLFDVSVTLPWGVSLAVASAVGAATSLVIGIPALRARGLFLAVVTLAMAVAASEWLFRQATFTGSPFERTTPFMSPPKFAGIDFANRRAFYYLCLLCLIAMTVIMIRVRRTGLGRAMQAVNNNEDTAAAATISPKRIKLVAFVLAGAMAAFTGALFVTLRVQVDPAAAFTPAASIELVATAIIGGIGSVAGPILGALLMRGLPAIVGDVEEVRLVTSGVGVLILLMYFPGGIMQLVVGVRNGLVSWADSRHVVSSAVPPGIARSVQTRRRSVVEHHGGPSLRLSGVTVRFGGNAAVNDVSIEVRPEEVVGLIGTNGAGKSTLMNAVGGFVPSTGRIEILGHDVADFPPNRRHLLGMGRGFQAARLFPDLTVRETLMVALEARERTLVLPSLVGVPPSPASERRKRCESLELIDLLGLGAYADQFIANLSTGTRRIVELGCLLAADAKLLMLDEPTGGVAQREAEAFGPLITRIRRDLGAAMVVIEHDMPLIMSISDRVYCLESGKVIADGAPEAVRNDPLVVASYLGTDDRAIQRSGSTQAAR
ncbi:ABC transporter permease subunit [Actinospongicola halichondriae]|uniref:ABC transporter permease subunit n=1 Tax=Actinospongicola halichondriae TaxID=3236844 RepID=UPI003D38F47D